MKRIAQKANSSSTLLRTMLFACICNLTAISALASTPSSGIRVQGPDVPPRLMFACCDQGLDQMRSLFANPNVIADLKDLHAGLAVAILDFTPERAQLVRKLNQAGIPVIGWLMLPADQGLYFNVDNASEAAARFAAFDSWTREQNLHWDGVGLDIEPNFAEFAARKGHPLRLLTTLLSRTMDGQRVRHARQEYSALIRTIHSRGYPVQTYQLPLLPAEREAHSSLLERTLGTVDVRGDQEALMLYTSFAPSIDGAMIWTLGPHAQLIVIGSTDGDLASGAPLNWNEFSRDLIVASHFSQTIGIYNLEGCVRQSFLQRLKTFDWSQSVTIPADALQKANRLHHALLLALWIASHLPYLIASLLLAIALVVWRRRARSQRLCTTPPNL
jgi:hypothetical protein